MPVLRIEIEGQRYEARLPDAPVRVGHGEECELRLNSSTIAREHCRLEPLPGGLFKVCDSSSGMPTMVNGVSIKQVSLRTGDEIRLGGAVLRLLDDESDEARALRSRDDRGGTKRASRNGTSSASAANGQAREPAARTSGVDAESATPSVAPTAVTTARATDDATPSAATTATKKSEGRSSSRARSKGSPILWIGGALCLGILGYAFLAGSGAGKSTARESLEMKLSQGLTHFEAKRYDKARAIWTAVKNDPRARAAGVDASAYLRKFGMLEGRANRALEAVWKERLYLDDTALQLRRQDYVREFGESFLPRLEEKFAAIRKAKTSWLSDQVARLESSEAQAWKAHKYAAARDVWAKLKRAAPSGIDVSDVVNERTRAIEIRVREAATTIRSRAETSMGGERPDTAVALIERVLSRFEGFEEHKTLSTLLEEAKKIDARVTAALAASGPRPGRTRTPGTTDQPKEPTSAEQRRLAEIADQDTLSKVRAEWTKFVASFDFRAGQKQAEAAKATMRTEKGRKALTALLRDMRDCQDAAVDLSAHINTNGTSYRGIGPSKSLRGFIESADDKGIQLILKAGSTRIAWAKMQPTMFGTLIDRRKPDGELASKFAALAHARELDERANALLVHAVKTGANKDAVFTRVAFWRDEDVPAGGYVDYEGRFVSPEVRERLLQEAAITASLSAINHKDAATRKKAYEHLLALGDAVADRFLRALTSRRATLLEELRDARGISYGKYRKRLWKLLEERRVHALSLILNRAEYPYPNPQKKNQAEVEARVDKVRQIWERPLELIAEWDKRMGERLSLISEVSEVLERAGGDAKAGAQALTKVINDKVDMPSHTPTSKSAKARAYSLKVLSFNEQIETTATGEEKDNVRAVNEYRMMMGLRAVKIHERLVRAARGHSRHMRVNGYFAHNVPPGKNQTKSNVTPGARAKKQGYGGGVGENIAMGTPTGRDAFWAWFGSSGHHRNMLSRWTEMGAGRSGGVYWTQLFGAATGFRLKQLAKLPDPPEAFAPEPEHHDGTPRRPGSARLPDEAPPQDGEWDGGEDEDAEDGEASDE